MPGFPPKVNIFLTSFVVILLVVLKAQQGHSANILFYVTVGYSHREAIEPLAHKLVENGHNVTFFSCERAARPNPKFNQFCPPPIAEFMRTTASELTYVFFKARIFSRYINFCPSIFANGYLEQHLCSIAYDDPQTQWWIKSQQFDLVVIDSSNQKCSYALAYKFGAPTISYSPSGFMNHESETWGFSGETSWAPSFAIFNVFTKERTFYDRLFQEVYPLFTKFITEWFVIPRIDRSMRKVLELPDMPSVKELEQKTSLMFFNLHYGNDYPRAFPPFVVPIGGMHCDHWNNATRTVEVPKHMSDFIDGAGEDGFMLVSFGSIIVQMSHFSEEMVNTFFDSIRGRKTRFLWKWDIDPPKNVPENVLAAKWLPQQSLMSHSKLKGFISHGGLMSYQQCACYGVPSVIIPIMFDQPYNGLNAQHIHHTGIHLELSDITRETLTSAIDSILTNKMYAENAKKVQQRFLDRPISPVDLANYWTEHVLKHKNTSYLKPTLAMNQYWWQRRLLDVWLFILILFIGGSWLAYKIAKKINERILRLFSSSSKKSHVKSQLKSKTN